MNSGSCFLEVVVEDDPRGGDGGSRLVDAASLRVVFHPAHVRERAVLRRPPRVRRDVREDVAHERGARLVMRRDDSGKVLGPVQRLGSGDGVAATTRRSRRSSAARRAMSLTLDEVSSAIASR